MRGVIFVLAIGCGGGQSSPPREETPSPTPAAVHDAAPAQSSRATSQTMSLGATMTELLALADSGPPAATVIEQAFVARSTRQDRDVGRKGDVHLTMQGDIASLKIWEDSRGWGAYTDVAVAKGSLADLEAVVGPTKASPRNPDDFSSGEKRAAYVTRAGKTIRVFAELDKTDPTQVRKVTVHFQR